MSRKRKRGCKDGRPEYWQSEAFNDVCFNVNVDLLLSLAVNRFRWVGLPSTCDYRFFERMLHTRGIATICHSEETPDIWQSLQCAPEGQWNEYGLPVRWRAIGMNGTQYDVTPDRGEICYYSQTRLDPWKAIYMYANKLTQYQRSEDVNLFQQRTPTVFVAPNEKRLELENILKQVSGFEPAILGDKSLLDLKQENVFTLPNERPLIVEDLALGYQNVLNQALLFLGIPHLAFEKGERMIEDEARANSMPTGLNLKNCLDARRYMCERLRLLDPERFKDTYVYFNDDWESYNFNYTHNVESQAQDGVLAGDVDEQSRADAQVL